MQRRIRKEIDVLLCQRPIKLDEMLAYNIVGLYSYAACNAQIDCREETTNVPYGKLIFQAMGIHGWWVLWFVSFALERDAPRKNVQMLTVIVTFSK